MLRTLAITTMSLMMMACASGPSYTNSAGESAATANLKYNVGNVQIKLHSPDIKELPDQKGLEQLLTKKLGEKLAENSMKANAGNSDAARININMQLWRNLAGSAFDDEGKGTGIANPWVAYNSNITLGGKTLGYALQDKGILNMGILGNLAVWGDMFSMDPKIEEGHFDVIAEHFVELLQNGN